LRQFVQIPRTTKQKLPTETNTICHDRILPRCDGLRVSSLKGGGGRGRGRESKNNKEGSLIKIWEGECKQLSTEIFFR
jgi:hypothetical protein